MARKKNSRRSERSVPKLRLGDAALAKMLRELGISYPGAGSDIEELDEITDPGDLLHEWEGAIGSLLSSHGVDKRRRGE